MDENAPEHYYGDTIRRLFMFAATVMVVSLPFVLDFIQVPLFISLFGILSIGLFAGLTNPRDFWVAVLNLLISATAVLVFEWFAVDAYLKQWSSFFVVNQLLAIIFLFALYYSTKTVRGRLNN